MKKIYKILVFAVSLSLFLAYFSLNAYADSTKTEIFSSLSPTSCRKTTNMANVSSTFLAKPVKSSIQASTESSNTYYITTEDGKAALPEEYKAFVDSLPDGVTDNLGDGALADTPEALSDGASENLSVGKLLQTVIDAFGSSLGNLAPTLALLCGIILLAAVCHVFASSVSPSLGVAVDFATRLCAFSAIVALALSRLDRLEEYFNNLLAAVGAFVPLSGVLYAMGGNLSGAASSSITLSSTLAVCEFFLNKTVIPVFCLCLALTLLQTFDGATSTSGLSVSATVKKWYTTALSFVMTILTVAICSQSILASKADGAAMRGAKFAAGSFIPVSGGTLASTLGALSSSVELLRGAVGGIGVAVILLLLIPIIIELALLRGIFSLTAFVSGVLGCPSEQRLLSEVSSLYGYLEGIAALSAAVFIIAFGIFASSAAAVGRV